MALTWAGPICAPPPSLKTETMLDKAAGNTPLQAGPDATVADMVRLIQGVQERLGKSGLVGVGIGVPGFIRMETGVIAGWGATAGPSPVIRFATRLSKV